MSDADDAPDCTGCPHSWREHDGMGDCHHPDARTLTGLCNCGDNQ